MTCTAKQWHTCSWENNALVLSGSAGYEGAAYRGPRDCAERGSAAINASRKRDMVEDAGRGGGNVPDTVCCSEHVQLADHRPTAAHFAAIGGLTSQLPCVSPDPLIHPTIPRKCNYAEAGCSLCMVIARMPLS